VGPGRRFWVLDGLLLLMSFSFDRPSTTYRIGDTVNVIFTVSPTKRMKETTLEVAFGYGLGAPDCWLQKEKVTIPALWKGEAFSQSFSFKVPQGPLTYLGYEANVAWGVHSTINKVPRGSKMARESVSCFTVLPNKEDAGPVAKPSLEVALLPDLEGGYRYRESSGPWKSRLLPLGLFLWAFVFSAIAIVCACVLVSDLLYRTGPSPFKEAAPLWLRIAFYLIGSLIALGLLVVIPGIFGLKGWKLLWHGHMRQRWQMKRLGPVEMNEEQPFSLGEPWHASLSLCPRKKLDVETLKIALIEQEMVLSSTDGERIAFPPHILGEWLLVELSDLKLERARVEEISLKACVGRHLPGSWCVVRHEPRYFDLRHRWVLQLEIKFIGEAPMKKEWLLLVPPTADYEPRVSKPTDHY
jgi:hypothetical protein